MRTCSIEGCDRKHDAKGLCSMHYGRLRHGGDPLVQRNFRSVPFEERFWMRVEKSDGCWEWTAARNQAGYGLVGVGKAQSAKAHRVAWEMTYGAIPAGDMVCHRCDNPPCVRPDHLFLGSSKDNASDREAKGRNRPAPAVAAAAAKRREQTHCKNGHPFDEANTRWNKDGRRACRACARENTRRYRERH